MSRGKHRKVKSHHKAPKGLVRFVTPTRLTDATVSTTLLGFFTVPVLAAMLIGAICFLLASEDIWHHQKQPEPKPLNETGLTETGVTGD